MSNKRTEIDETAMPPESFPTAQLRFHSKCYLCDQQIDYPPELVDQIIPCPHCHREIRLFGSSKAASRRRWSGLFGTRWNKKQTFLTVVFLIIFAISLFNAPWEITTRDWQNLPQSDVRSGPMWDPPASYRSDTTVRHELLVAPLMLTWFGSFAGYALLIFLFRSRNPLNDT